MNRRVIKRFLIGTVGGVVLALGVAMIILPGPAVAVIPVGLAILGTEFPWAKRWLDKAKRTASKAKRATERRIYS